MRGQGGFDDRFGPSVLALLVGVAVVVNFVLRIGYGPAKDGQGHGGNGTGGR